MSPPAPSPCAARPACEPSSGSTRARRSRASSNTSSAGSGRFIGGRLLPSRRSYGADHAGDRAGYAAQPMRRAAALAITLARVVAPAAALAIIFACAGNAPAAAAHHSLNDGPGPRPGPAILYAAPATAPQLTNAVPVAGAADPRLGHHRLPRSRVPLPGLSLRRPRSARGRGSARSSRRRLGQSVLQAERHLHLSDRTRVRQRRRRSRRVPGQAAARRHRIPRSR